MLRWLLLCVAGAATGAAAPTVPRTIFIVAGQSNVLNWHADAAALPAHAADAHIAFFYHTGAPPSKGGTMSTSFNATSAGAWTSLRPQRQEPYGRFYRDFFGPEMSLGRALFPQGPGSLGIIKVGYFGTTLAEDWNPSATTGNRLYALLLEQVRAARRQLAARGEQVRLGGFFWLQGESDGARLGAAQAYAANLRAFIIRVRRDLANDSADGATLPFVLARIGPPPASGYPHQELVRAAQVQVADALPGVAWVDTDDLPRDTDGIHLLAAGVLTLGERWAAAWRRQP